MGKSVLLVLALLAAGPAYANHCKKGQPCGNSCISWKKTCHIKTYREADGNTTRKAPDPDAKPINGPEAIPIQSECADNGSCDGAPKK